MVALDHQRVAGRSRAQLPTASDSLVTFVILAMSGLIGTMGLGAAVVVAFGPVPAWAWVSMGALTIIIAAFVTGAVHSIPVSEGQFVSGGRPTSRQQRSASGRSRNSAPFTFIRTRQQLAPVK